jgi:hypothetical protein
MKRSGIPPEVQVLLDWWLPRIREVLGPRLRAAILFGGAALGDYTPGRSDVDVCTVVDGGIPQDVGPRIARVHDQMREQFVVQPGETGRYRYVIEGQYIPPEIVTDSRAVGDCYVAWGRTRQGLHGNPITPFDRYSLSRYGICVWGQDLRFAPASREELLQQLHEDLVSLTDPPAESLASPRWVAMMITWTARSMIFWRDGAFLSKPAALKREIASGGPFAETYRLALAAHAGGSAFYEQHAVALREHFDRIARPAAASLRQLAEGRLRA